VEEVGDTLAPAADSLPAGDSAMPEEGAAYPATCAAAQTMNGTVMLYVGGDAGQGWQATCVNGVSFLALHGSNYSSYRAGACAKNAADAGAADAGTADGGAGVVTTWSMIHVDPVTLLVDTADYTGSSSSGAVMETSGNGMYEHLFTELPYAAGRTCVDGPPTKEVAQIDLQGTPFTVGGSAAFFARGYSTESADGGPLSMVEPDGGGNLVELYVGGYPAGISPCPNDYYQTLGGPCLQLVYGP
jgi:hypothetical protein